MTTQEPIEQAITLLAIRLGTKILRQKQTKKQARKTARTKKGVKR